MAKDFLLLKEEKDADPQISQLITGSYQVGGTARSDLNESQQRVVAPSGGFLDVFEKKYATKLLHRASSMRGAFAEMLRKRTYGFVIVETGCVSKVEGDGITYGPATSPDHPWHPGGWHGPWSAGMSTVLFDEFVRLAGGRVFSVDQNDVNCQVARRNTSDQTVVVCADSVKFLHSIDHYVPAGLIDMLYLDSYDCDWDNPHLSSLHHMKELAAVFGRLASGCLILVDDCQDSAGRSGKGMYVRDFLTDLGYHPLIDEYQVLWKK